MVQEVSQDLTLGTDFGNDAGVVMGARGEEEHCVTLRYDCEVGLLARERQALDMVIEIFLVTTKDFRGRTARCKQHRVPHKKSCSVE